MPKCPPFITNSILKVLNNYLYPIPSKFLSLSMNSNFSALAIPSTKTIETEPQHRNASDRENDIEHDRPISDKIFKSGPKMGSYKLGDSTFYSVINNYANLGDFKSLEKVLDRMRCEKRVIVEKCFVVIFKAYGKAHLPEKAVDLFDRMAYEFECKRTVKSFNSVLNVIIQEGLFYRALEFYNHVIGAKGVRKLEKAISLLDRMVSSKCVPNVVTYGTIINGLVKQGRALDGARVLALMEERGYRVNEYVYSALISGLFKEGKSQEAMQLFKEMTVKECEFNTIVYSVVIDGLCRDGKPDEALEVLFEMTNNRCEPNAYTYSSLMKGFFEAGNGHKAIEVWKDMAKHNFTQNEVCYSVLIHGLCKDGKVEEAMMSSISRAIDLLNSMLDRGCDPDLVTCIIFLRTLREKLDPTQDGREFLDGLVVRLLKRQRVLGSGSHSEVLEHPILLMYWVCLFLAY
ncbi:hypothetical protein NC653_009331 [Populus alba x Populus x berolinensis]|uniref:Pentatricopeptide repeat-containing protein n=1 Tax=Populus alba x Populus x berolinensis TaxID=444605 RepID=A0AAD6R8P4_9ROSI|nr:hypothetical protein NC653_009331 [Populus alba x Populus x berolinensis]